MSALGRLRRPRLWSLGPSTFCCLPHIGPVLRDSVVFLLDQNGLQSFPRYSFLLDPDSPGRFFRPPFCLPFLFTPQPLLCRLLLLLPCLSSSFTRTLFSLPGSLLPRPLALCFLSGGLFLFFHSPCPLGFCCLPLLVGSLSGSTLLLLGSSPLLILAPTFLPFLISSPLVS